MRNRIITIGIPAYTIFPGGGLTLFLFQAIKALSTIRPAWNWKIIGTLAMPEIKNLRSSNVQIEFWDESAATRIIYYFGKLILSIIGKKYDSGYLLQNRAERYRLPLGKANNRIISLQDVNAIWVPHYNISLNRIALINDLQSVEVPILLTIHDIHPVFFSEDYSKDDLARFYDGFIPFTKKCRRIITHSNFQKLAIIKNLNLNCADILTTPQPPLIDPSFFTKKCDCKRSINLSKRLGILRQFIFYPASTTHAHKNHKRLLAVWKELKLRMGKNCPMLVCTAKGDNQQWTNLSSLIKAYHLENDVVFTGLIDLQTLAELYSGCIMVVVPTLYEGAGSGIFTDALVMGKPVICSDIPQIHEQVSALGPIKLVYFDPTDMSLITQAIIDALVNLKKLQQEANENQTKIKLRFTKIWETWAEFYATEIESITSSSSP